MTDAPSFSPENVFSKIDFRSKKVLIGIAVIILALILMILYGVKSGARSKALGPQDVAKLVNLVSRHIVVKPAETPSVATVQDSDLLRKQNPIFYADAQNGDRLLIWSDKAVLYSPSRDVILAVLPLNLLSANAAGNAAGQLSAQAPQEKASIEVRNGSTTAGFAKTVGDKLKVAGLDVVKTGNAKGTYERTLIVKISDKPLTATLTKLHDVFGVPVVALPTDELTSKADVLVIVGKDFKP